MKHHLLLLGGVALSMACMYTPLKLEKPGCLAQGQDGCDDIDNDCDEQIDEDCCEVEAATRTCGSSVGRCEAGERTCTGGLWSGCVGEIPPEAEPCTDAVDHDCDGLAGCLDMDCYDHGGCATLSCPPTSGPLTCNSSTPLDTSSAENTMSWYSCLPWDETGGELVYTLTVDNPADVTITIVGQDPGTDVDVMMLSGACDPNECRTHGDRETVFPAVPNETYYVVVDSYQGRAGGFDLNVWCAFQTEVCANGIDDDGNSYIDCDDVSCTNAAQCDPVTCQPTTAPLLPCNAPLYPNSHDVLSAYSDCSISGLTGPEDIWRLQSPVGGTVELFFDPGTIANTQLLLMGNLCGMSGDCTDAGNQETVTLEPGQTSYVVVDGTDGERDYTLRAICSWEDCATIGDDNDNGLINEADPAAPCYVGVLTDPEENCFNGVDDDDDVHIDCDDPDCSTNTACTPELCHRGSQATCDWSFSGSTAQAYYSTSVINSYGACGIPSMGLPENAFSFLAPGSGPLTVTATAHDGGEVPIFLLADSCSGSSCVEHGAGTLTYSVVAGTTYFIVVDSDDRVFNFDLNVACGFEPCISARGPDGELVGSCSNEGCDGTPLCPSGVCDTTAMTEITSCTFSDSGDTAGLPNNLAQYGCDTMDGIGAASTGGERIYHLRFDHDQVVSVNFTSTDDAHLFLLEGECRDWTCVGEIYQAQILSLRRDQDYYFVADGHTGTYTLTLSCETWTSENSGCANGIDEDDDGAIDCADPDCEYNCYQETCQASGGSGKTNDGDPLGCGSRIADTTVNSGSNWGATDIIDDYDCGVSWGALGPEKAYELVVPTNGPVNIDFHPLAHLKWYILQGECRPEACVAAHLGEPFDAVGGRLYYLVVDGVEDDAAGPFELTINCD